jgi:hypothetical protein
MIVRHRAFLATMLLGLAGNLSTAFARGSLGNSDPPWNAEHIDHLPEEVRKAVTRLCGQPPNAAHYFATYSENSRLISLHFEHYHCPTNKTLCTQAGCLHQVYVLSGGHYRLLRSCYRQGND